ncbi:MAG: hypothetical protein SFU56_21085, partial [Capsulimonadales bacterium]|nr:hypothetical protein [Capsulimonadales bacterium]
MLPAVLALRYGSFDALPEPLPLVAGPLSCLYEDGELRSVRCGEELLLLRVYAAVRDRDWGTVPAQVAVREQTVFNEGFRIVFDTSYVRTGENETIRFVSAGRIEGKADGSIVFEFEGEAKTTFQRNRIGFCLLHPAEWAGHPVIAEFTGGRTETAHFPGLVDPAQPVFPFTRLRALLLTTGTGERIEVRMEGDAFEMEDQRNWTDASFKTFCTPLSLPYPIEIPVGTRIVQRITVRTLPGVHTPRPVGRTTPSRRTPSLELHPGESARLPEIGFGHHRPHPRRDLTRPEEDHLQALAPAHLRVDVRFTGDWRKNLAYVARYSRRWKTPLAVAIYLPADADRQAKELKAMGWEIRQSEAEIGRWQIYPEQEVYTGQNWPTIPKETLRAIAPDAPILTGSDTDFLFFNRFEGTLPEVNGVVFQINPQVHAFDNASLMETPLAYEAVVETARFRARNLPVHISPLTLKPRYNPYARSEKPPSIPPDPRQKSLFAAAWTVCALSALTAAGVRSVTLFDLIGDTGLAQGDWVFPAWIPLGWLASVATGEAFPLSADDPRRAA